MENYNALAIVDSIDNQVVVATMNKINQFQAIIQNSLKDGRDFGKIPGAGDKPSLFKPGAEKINMLFGLCPNYVYLDRNVDFERGFFSYEIRCTLEKNGVPVSQGVGSCNSHEIKYRYINVDEAKLSEYGIPAESAVKFTNKYGQTKYKIEAPDPADKANTILKMAKKRAYVDATLQVASLSDLFTQDMEDQAEQYRAEVEATMTVNEAGAIKLNFGKHKGKSLRELFNEDIGYLDWLSKAEKTDPVIRKALSVIFQAAEKKANKTQAAPQDNTQEPTIETKFTEYTEDDEADMPF